MESKLVIIVDDNETEKEYLKSILKGMFKHCSIKEFDSSDKVLPFLKDVDNYEQVIILLDTYPHGSMGPDVYSDIKKEYGEERFVVIGTSGSSDEVSHLWEAVEVSDILNKHSTAKVIEDFISSKISEYEKQQRKRNLKPSRRSQLEALHHSQYHP